MTIDKIKHHVSPVIFNYWQSVKDASVITNGQKQLQFEIDNKIRTSISDFAELKLLQLLLS